MWEDNFGNVFDYIKWRGDLTFEQSELNVVDSLIFSILTYVNFSLICDMEYCGNHTDSVSISKFFSYINRNKISSDQYCTWILEQKEYDDFFRMVAGSRRFRNVRVFRYSEKFDEDIREQFAAMTFLYSKGKAFIAFRGTDNTMAGWEEDFNMSFLDETPGQLTAKDYVNKIASEINCEISLGGHSKGGNFAVWSAVNCDDKYHDKISHVYNNDGPGFSSNFINSDNYHKMDAKILSFVPESSIVGMMMSYCKFVTIKSTKTSVLQHDPFSWVVSGRGFVYDVEQTKRSKKLVDKINKAVDKLTEEQKSELVSGIFDSLENKSIKTTGELKNYVGKHLLRIFPEMVKVLGKLKDEIKKSES